MDNIRILRIVEYVGPRDLVEACLERSIHGTRIVTSNGKREYRIRATTLGDTAEILAQADIHGEEETVDAQG